jgi:hypothetical protein
MQVVWDVSNALNEFAVGFASSVQAFSVRRVGPARKPARCPECRAILYTRRHKLCAVCGHLLPEALLFTPVESKRIEQLIRTERLLHRQWMRQRS